MDLLEKINKSFGTWYEGLFGGSGDDVRPKDVLRRIIAAMEDNRKEGFDNRVYVPNQYILEIAVDDEEEKDYLLSFLDRDELEAALVRYCKQNHYHVRGTLDFTIKELSAEEIASERKPEKLRVRCRYNTKITAPEMPATPGVAANPAIPYEERTIGAFVGQSNSDEAGTVPAIAAATLIIYAPDKPPFRYAIAKGAITIGRSARSGNDIVLENDGQSSKRHSRIELDADGKFTVYDLGSTNGTKVNGRRVENRTLHDGDEIVIGQTRITFQQSKREEAFGENEDEDDAKPRTTPGVYGGAAASLNPNEMGSSTPPRRVLTPRTARLMLLEGTEIVDDFLLASETVIGRGVTNDIVLPDRSIATRHARIVHNGEGYAIEVLNDTADARLNGLPLLPHFPTGLRDNDAIELGTLKLRFEEGLQENR